MLLLDDLLTTCSIVTISRRVTASQAQAEIAGDPRAVRSFDYLGPWGFIGMHAALRGLDAGTFDGIERSRLAIACSSADLLFDNVAVAQIATDMAAPSPLRRVDPRWLLRAIPSMVVGHVASVLGAQGPYLFEHRSDGDRHIPLLLAVDLLESGEADAVLVMDFGVCVISTGAASVNGSAVVFPPPFRRSGVRTRRSTWCPASKSPRSL